MDTKSQPRLDMEAVKNPRAISVNVCFAEHETMQSETVSDSFDLKAINIIDI